jgi:hypothetical protein
MNRPNLFTITILPVPKLISRSPLWRRFLVGALAVTLALFALSPMARAVTPAPDGGYPNGNTAEGDGALFNLTTGSDNTAIGFEALNQNTTGGGNTANGFEALGSNTTGDANTANGFGALVNNTTGSVNTASGAQALRFNTNGGGNTATGGAALEVNTAGSNNTATGAAALNGNSTGNSNTASGANALESNTTGFDNTASGAQALRNNTGSSNIALGTNAGINLTTGDNNIDIGAPGVAGEGNTIRIGKRGFQKATHIAGIYGTVVAGGVGVIVDTHGQLGTILSSARYKEAIKPMDKASEAILALKPVTFRYKHELDPDGIPQFGLVAEQVEKVNPDLVVRDDQRKVNTVRYEAVNAMLLNEFLKEHRTVQELKSVVGKQEATIAQQQKDFQSIAAQQQEEIRALTASLKEQAAQIKKVSAQLEVSKTAPQLVADNQ